MSAVTQRRMAAATAILLLLTALQMVLSVGVTSAVASTVEPTYVAGNPTCSDFGDSDELLKIEKTGQLTDADDGTYTSGDLAVTITVYETEAGWEFDWTANMAIGVVVAKGGPGANVYTYTSATADTGLHAPFNDGSESWYGLSHISFCSTMTTQTGSASLTVEKDVNVAAPAAGFDFTVTGEEPFELADGEFETFTYTLDPASETVVLTVAEGAVPTHFDFVSVSCSDGESTVGTVDGASVDVTLADGDDITCTFVNTYEAPSNTGSASLTVEKDVNVAAPSAGFDFTVTGEEPFELADGEFETFTYTLDPASETVVLTVAEGAVPTHFDFVSVSCSDGESTVGTVDGASVDVTLADGDDITCTFVNTYDEPTTPTTRSTTPTTVSELGAIGDYVWLDLDRDGRQDANETPVSGATVQLLSPDGTVLATQVTGADGLYLFDDLPAGNYRVQVTFKGAVYTTPRAPGISFDVNSDVDSLGDGVGLTALISLDEGEIDLTWDAGLVVEVLAAQVESTTTVAPVAVDTLPFTGLGAEEMLVLALVVSAAGGLLLFSTARAEDESVSTETIGRWSSD